MQFFILDSVQIFFSASRISNRLVSFWLLFFFLLCSSFHHYLVFFKGRAAGFKLQLSFLLRVWGCKAAAITLKHKALHFLVVLVKHKGGKRYQGERGGQIQGTVEQAGGYF
ncbi:hypothetical protein QBC44DRAFT_92003 [Cladorrhinum sp. PSN332]|nr:hypothetical protein QBC44DRAFT_92003 [Cladorrhinum sp. PSN332]